MKKQQDWREKYAEVINTIQKVALDGSGENRVSKKISDLQAVRVFQRSNKLIEESKRIVGLSPEKLTQQINKCYDQRLNRRA